MIKLDDRVTRMVIATSSNMYMYMLYMLLYV